MLAKASALSHVRPLRIPAFCTRWQFEEIEGLGLRLTPIDPGESHPLPVPTGEDGRGSVPRLGIELPKYPAHGGIQETGFRARDEAPSLAYPVHQLQVRSRIGMAAQHWTDSRRRARILTKVEGGVVPRQGIVCVTVTTHPRHQGRFLPALAALDASPRRDGLAGFRIGLPWTQPFWRQPIVAGARWDGGAGGVAACVVGRRACFRPPSVMCLSLGEGKNFSLARPAHHATICIDAPRLPMAGI